MAVQVEITRLTGIVESQIASIEASRTQAARLVALEQRIQESESTHRQTVKKYASQQESGRLKLQVQRFRASLQK